MNGHSVVWRKKTLKQRLNEKRLYHKMNRRLRDYIRKDYTSNDFAPYLGILDRMLTNQILYFEQTDSTYCTYEYSMKCIDTLREAQRLLHKAEEMEFQTFDDAKEAIAQENAAYDNFFTYFAAHFREWWD